MSQAIGTAIIKFVTGAAKVNAIVANVVGTAALMVGASILTPKARFGNVKERDSLNIRGINSRGSTDSRSYIYGQVRVGGTVVYMETTGTDNEFLHMVLVHCDHEVEELGDVYVNDVKVDFDTASEGSLRNAQGTRYRNSLYIADHLGGPSQTVDSTLDAASGKWYSSDKLSGMAYTYIRMELKTGEDNAFPNGIPTFTRVVKGRKVYDPRLDSTQTGIGGSGSHRADDSTTWEWSDNWALCVADYITSDFGYGRFGNGWSNINIQELADSADNCDETVNEVFASWSNGETVSEGWRRSVDVYLLRANNDGTTGSTIPDHTGWSIGDTVNDGTVVWTVQKASLSNTATRYTLNGIVEADEDPLEVVKEMKGAAAGFIEYIGGSWVITSGRYQAPTITLTESDFAGPITGTSKDDRTRAINGVRGVIANQDDAYNVIDVPPISSAAYVTEDNGVESFRDLKLLYTTSTSAAQRLFKIELLRARQSLGFRSTFTASAFRLKAGDTFSLDFDRYGWSGKVFQVWSTQLKVGGDGELVVDVEFRETASNVYSYTAITDETVVDPAPNTSLPDPFTVTAPTGMAAASGTDQLIETSDGTILPTVLVTWTAAASVNVIGYQIRWRLASETNDQDYRYLTVNGRNNTSSVITGVRESRGDANQYIDIDIRSLTPVKEGEWTIVEHDHDVIGKSAAPTAPTGFSALAIVEGVRLSMDEHPDLDFKQFLIYQNTTNSKPGTHSYVTTDTTKTITGLTSGQIYYFWLEAEDTTAHTTAAASNVNATPTAVAAGDVENLGFLATEDSIDLGTEGNGGVTTGTILPVTNTEATDNGTTIDTSGNVNAAIDFTDSGAIKHGKTSSDDASNAGFWLGEDGQATPDYDFHIGDSSNSLKWDGSASTLTVKGDLTAGSVDIGSGLQRTQIDSNGTSSWGSGRIQINASDSFFGDVGQKWLGSPYESIWIDCNTTTLPARLYFGNTSTGSLNAFITGQGNAEFKTLDVTTSLDLNSSTLDASNGVGTSGQVLSSTGSGTQWIDSAAGLWTQSGSDIYYNTGNVGINDSSPSYKLDVNGTGRFTDTLTASGGINGLTLSDGISGNNFNITGVNQLNINDPGEGIVFQGTTNVVLAAIDDSTDSIMNFANATELRRDGNKVWDAGNTPHDFGESFAGVGYQSGGADLNDYRDLGDHVFYNSGGASTANSPFSSGYAYAWTAGGGDNSSRGIQFAANYGTSAKMYWREMSTSTTWRELLTTDANGNCTASANLDDTLTFGRAKIGYVGYNDYAGFAHYDQASSTGYALLQGSSGDTFLNCQAGRLIYFREGNSTKGYYDGSVDRWNFGGSATQIGTTVSSNKLNVGGSVGLQAANGNGYRFWNHGGGAYGIHMSSWGDSTWGGRLDTSSDYNMYFRMTGGSNRGFVFQNNTTEVAQIDGSGNFYHTGNLYSARPSDAWTTSTTWIELGAGGAANNRYGTINTGGSYAVTFNGNGYRNSSGTWTSLLASPSSYTGATQIWQYPQGYITFNANTSHATGSSSVVAERMRVHGNGDVSIGTSSGGYKFRVAGTTYLQDQVTIGDAGSEGGEIRLLDANNATTQAAYLDIDAANNARLFQVGNGNLHLGNLTGGTGNTRIYCNADLKIDVKSTQTEITDQLYVSGHTGGDSIVTINGIDCGGGMLVQGSLDVDVDLDVSGTKNFRIAHPVRDGYDLRHTCVESPQADLTYRGQATLVDGAVQVDLDSEFGMTAGTFAALNDEVQVFVQNESGWDAVRGSVSDGVLTIDCQNTNSTDSVGWLVIGRRIGIELEIEPETKIK